MPNKVIAPGEAENTEFNHKAVKSSAGNFKKSDEMCKDYSIKSKKEGTYKVNG